jgi:hypothetical protein
MTPASSAYRASAKHDDDDEEEWKNENGRIPPPAPAPFRLLPPPPPPRRTKRIAVLTVRITLRDAGKCVIITTDILQTGEL